MITRGSRGSKIKEIQNLLKQEGSLKYPTATGFVGKNTHKAIQDYQTKRGLKIDGKYGDRTKDMLENENYAKALTMSPSTQNTPFQELLTNMYNKGDHGINMGKGGQMVTPEMLTNRYKQMDDDIQKYYA